MALLDTFRPEFEAQALNTIKAPPPPPGPGVFHNFASSAGNAFMRGMAETARAGSMALAAVPVAIDALNLKDNFSGERVSDRYFKWHDETFQRAVDYWTPRPDDVGAAGQIVGSLGAGLVQFLANPALMVGTAQLSTAEDLVRKGVDPGASLVAGDIAGLSTVAGIGLPIFGRTLGQRIAAGAVGNLVTNVPEAALKRAVVNAAGSPEAAAQFDPWDVQARIVDVLMGVAFGAKAHMDARTVDALMVMNAAKHMESAALPNRGTDAELTQGVENLRTAVDQMLRGEPVALSPVASAARSAMDGSLRPERVEVADFFDSILPQQAKPIADPDMATAAPRPEPDTTQPGPPRFADDLKLPTGEFDATTGEPGYASANDIVARAAADAERVKATAQQLAETAAACLLGSV